jgi:phosphomethylpyrimidine synthase
MTDYDTTGTILEAAATGQVTDPVMTVALREGRNPRRLLSCIANGSIVIMRRGNSSLGIGEGLRTKVNVNIGSSHTLGSLEDEVKKAEIAETFGADTISDLSTGGDIRKIREAIFEHTSVPITTVPVYQAAAECGIENMTEGDILATIREQAAAGVSSMVLHCMKPDIIDCMKRQDRILGVVSKGGAIIGAYMHLNNCANPYTEMMDEILAIFRKHDIVLSLGNTARSGCIHDKRDAVAREELKQNIAIAGYAHERGVQVIIEGAGGHTRYDRIPGSVREYKKASPFPLFVAGPLPTDVALGYDHIAGCVGASAAVAAGADYLCSVTPSEHLGLPGPDQVKEGLIAFRIAAHIGDMVKLKKDGPDRELAMKRAQLDREGQFSFAMDEVRARQLAGEQKTCSMCGDFCAIRLMKGILQDHPENRGRGNSPLKKE